MFLRKNRRRAGGETYEYWTLCESVRTATGPGQRVVATLGKLSDEDIEAGWEGIEALLEGRAPQRRPQQTGFWEVPREEAGPQAGWELADLKNLSVERVREFGSVYLALALWRRLGLPQLLEKLMGRGREQVAWSEVAAVLTVGKFCGQASELEVAESWYGRTGRPHRKMLLTKFYLDRAYSTTLFLWHDPGAQQTLDWISYQFYKTVYLGTHRLLANSVRPGANLRRPGN